MKAFIEYYNYGSLQASIVEVKPISCKNAIYLKVKRKRDVITQFHNVNALLNTVESMCLCLLLCQARIMLRKKCMLIEEIEIAYDCRTPIEILVSIEIRRNRIEELKVLKELINGNLDYLHALKYSMLLTDQPGYRGCVCKGILK